MTVPNRIVFIFLFFLFGCKQRQPEEEYKNYLTDSISNSDDFLNPTQEADSIYKKLNGESIKLENNLVKHSQFFKLTIDYCPPFIPEAIFSVTKTNDFICFIIKDFENADCNYADTMESISPGISSGRVKNLNEIIPREYKLDTIIWDSKEFVNFLEKWENSINSPIDTPFMGCYRGTFIRLESSNNGVYNVRTFNETYKQQIKDLTNYLLKLSNVSLNSESKEYLLQQLR